MKMNLWVIVAIVAGLLIVGGIALVKAFSTETEETVDCSSCENTCTSERNCGLQICGAVSGGSCGCRS